MSTITNGQTIEDTHFEYDVVLSFAEENRKFVEVVANYLKRKHIKVYYDKDEKIDAWGRNLYTHLNEIYQYKARFCVMFISTYYKEKYWTQHEQISVQARQLIAAKSAYILPFRMDDTQIDGLPHTMGFLSINHFTEKKLAEAIITKLNKPQDIPKPLVMRADPKIGLSWLQKARRILARRIKIWTMIAVMIIAAATVLWDRLTPTAILAGRIYERNKKSIRAICRDGWLSPSHGRGTCSHHHGIGRLVDSFVYDKTPEQCKEEAKEISWLP